MNGYLSYLTNLISFGGKNNYHGLIDILFRIDFRWSVHNDDNRIADSMRLRDMYYEESGCSDDEYMELTLIPCTVLEVLISLAIRMDDYMRDPQKPHVDRWFWEMIDNLGLKNCKDSSKKWSENDVKNVIFVWLDREYDELGNGGIFPRNVTLLNQKQTELVNQMVGYLNERYFL